MNPDGKKVKRIYFPSDYEERIEVAQAYDTMVYEREADYEDCNRIDWIKCYKNGKLAAQYNARYLLGMEFVEEES